jgi:hypothetical protein
LPVLDFRGGSTPSCGGVDGCPRKYITRSQDPGWRFGLY